MHPIGVAPRDIAELVIERLDDGQKEISLIPISETRFRVGSTSLVTEFVIDDAGVTQVMGVGFQQLLARLNPKR